MKRDFLHHGTKFSYCSTLATTSYSCSGEYLEQTTQQGGLQNPVGPHWGFKATTCCLCSRIRTTNIALQYLNCTFLRLNWYTACPALQQHLHTNKRVQLRKEQLCYHKQVLGTKPQLCCSNRRSASGCWADGRTTSHSASAAGFGYSKIDSRHLMSGNIKRENWLSIRKMMQ